MSSRMGPNLSSRRDRMKINDVRKIAKGMDINTYRMKKEGIIRAIQQAENNMACFATERVTYCNEDKCLWRDDCLSTNTGRKPSRK